MISLKRKSGFDLPAIVKTISFPSQSRSGLRYSYKSLSALKTRNLRSLANIVRDPFTPLSTEKERIMISEKGISHLWQISFKKISNFLS